MNNLRYSFRRSHSHIGVGAVFGLAAFLALGVLGFNLWYTYGTGDEVDITVKDKERVVKSSGDSVSSKYLVYGDQETFENTDSFLKWKFGSSDIYRDLEAGKSYECQVYGKRVPFLSWYRNIVSCQPK